MPIASVCVLCGNLHGSLTSLSEKALGIKPGIVERHNTPKCVTLAAAFLALYSNPNCDSLNCVPIFLLVSLVYLYVETLTPNVTIWR